jgi:ribosome-associated translation inhibitor RaiA
MGFELSPSLRGWAEARLAESVRSFASHVHSAVVRLTVGPGRDQADETSCEIVVGLRVSGEVRVRTEGAKMQAAILGAIQGIRSALERQLSRPVSAPPAAPANARVSDAWARESAYAVVGRGEESIR